MAASMRIKSVDYSSGKFRLTLANALVQDHPILQILQDSYRMQHPETNKTSKTKTGESTSAEDNRNNDDNNNDPGDADTATKKKAKKAPVITQANPPPRGTSPLTRANKLPFLRLTMELHHVNVSNFDRFMDNHDNYHTTLLEMAVVNELPNQMLEGELQIVNPAIKPPNSLEVGSFIDEKTKLHPTKRSPKAVFLRLLEELIEAGLQIGCSPAEMYEQTVDTLYAQASKLSRQAGQIVQPSHLHQHLPQEDEYQQDLHIARELADVRLVLKDLIYTLGFNPVMMQSVEAAKWQSFIHKQHRVAENGCLYSVQTQPQPQQQAQTTTQQQRPTNQEEWRKHFQLPLRTDGLLSRNLPNKSAANPSPTTDSPRIIDEKIIDQATAPEPDET